MNAVKSIAREIANRITFCRICKETEINGKKVTMYRNVYRSDVKDFRTNGWKVMSEKERRENNKEMYRMHNEYMQTWNTLENGAWYVER